MKLKEVTDLVVPEEKAESPSAVLRRHFTMRECYQDVLVIGIDSTGELIFDHSEMTEAERLYILKKAWDTIG